MGVWGATADYANTYFHLYLDPNNDGGATPGADDVRLTIRPAVGATESHWSGGTWTGTARTAWDGTVLQNTGAAFAEYRIELGKFGISPGQAKTMRLGIENTYTGSSGLVWPDAMNGADPSTWAPLSSVPNWTIPDNVAPGGWAGFAPTLSSVRNPICTIQVSDSVGGLDVSRAEYRYTSNSGSTWSAWLPAANCSGSDGTTLPQTITSAAVPFPADSLTANRVQFRAFDMYGMVGTSGEMTVQVDATAPGGWAGFTPASVVADTASPDCSISVQDTGKGIDADSGEYRYSRNGGSTWSAWLPGTRTPTGDGYTGVTSFGAISVPFDQTSSANRMQFRIRDMAGVTGTSPVYSVTTSAIIRGLPLSGDVELGWVDRIPSLWRATYSYTAYGIPWSDTFPWYDAYVRNTEAAHFDGTRATAGRVFIQPSSSPRAYVAETMMTMASADDFTGVNEIELAMRDIDTSNNQGSGTFFNPHSYIAVDLWDGTTTTTVTLHSWDYTLGTVDNRVGTATGTDGATWNVYRIPLGSLVRSSITARLRWHVDGNLDPAGASVTCYSVVDAIHAVDIAPPVSQASGPTAYWSRVAPAGIGFTAADNSSLASITLQGQADTGGGWSPWTDWAAQAITGRSASGSFATPPFVSDGRYALRTIAVDSVGNTETVPVLPDAQFGVDSMGPIGWTGFSPSGWATSLSPACSVNVYDLTSGLERTPVHWGAGSAPSDVPTAMWSGDAHLLSAAGPFLSVVKVDDLSGSTAGSRDVGKVILDVAADSSGTWAFCGLDGGGVLPVDVSDPAAISPAAPAELGTVQSLALYEGGTRVLFAGRPGDPRVQILDASAPGAGMERLGEFEVRAPATHMMVTDNGVLLVATTVPEIETFDVRDPTRPQPLATLPFGDCGGLDVVGDYAFAGDTGGVIRVIDARDPRDVRFRGLTEVFRTIVDLVAEGDRVYVMTADDGARVASVSDPDAPDRLWELDRAFTGTNGGRLAVGRDCLVTESENAGRHVWTLTEPVCSWSSDGGVSWSDWYAAGEPSEGTTQTFTLHYSPHFAGDSASENLVRWRSGDVAGNVGRSPDYTVLVDTTAPGAPAISSTHSNPASWYPSAAPIMDWTVPSDTSGITGYSYLWADNSITDPDFVADTSDTTTRTTGVSEGQHWFSVRALDNAGRWGAASKLLYQVDTSPPGAPTGMAAAPSSWSSLSSYNVSWTLPVSTPSPLANIKYGVGTPPAGAGDGTFLPATATSVAIPFSTDGTTAVYVQGVDAAGNRGPFASVILYHDGTAPGAPVVSSSTHPVPTTYYGGATVTCAWTTPPDTSGITGYSIVWDDAAATVPDSVVDTTAVTASVAAGADGTHYFHVRARDAAGNWGSTGHFTYRVDRNAPGAPVISSPTHPAAADYYAGPTVTANWTVPADASGVTGYSIVWDDVAATVPDQVVDTTAVTASLAAGADGAHYFHVRARDALGNWGTTAHLTYRVDRNAPAAPVSPVASPSGWTNLTAFALSWTNPAGQVAPLASRWYKVGSAPTGPSDGTQLSGSTASLSLSGITTEGTQTVYVWLEDSAGNRSQANAVQFRIYHDHTAPGMTGPQTQTPDWNTWTSGDATVTWSNPPSDGLSPLAAKRYKFSTSISPPAAGDYDLRVSSSTPLLTFLSPPEGMWWVYVWLEDAAGNVGSPQHGSGQLYIDRTAPAAPQNLSVFPSSWSAATTCVVTWTNPTDGAWIAAHRYKVGAPPAGPADGTRVVSTQDRLEFPAPSTPGTYAVYLWLEDAAGNSDHTHYSSGVIYISSPRQWVYRFFNRQTGTHFYTGTEAERDDVLARLGWLYQYEGPAYQGLGGPMGGTPLYRFYNRRTGTHFYTANLAEKADVEARLGWLYSYEGIAYYVCAVPGNTNTVYRFYNLRNGVHFYTASQTERDSVIANLGWLFSYEGPAFYVPD